MLAEFNLDIESMCEDAIAEYVRKYASEFDDIHIAIGLPIEDIEQTSIVVHCKEAEQLDEVLTCNWMANVSVKLATNISDNEHATDITILKNLHRTRTSKLRSLFFFSDALEQINSTEYEFTAIAIQDFKLSQTFNGDCLVSEISFSLPCAGNKL